MLDSQKTPGPRNEDYGRDYAQPDSKPIYSERLKNIPTAEDSLLEKMMEDAKNISKDPRTDHRLGAMPRDPFSKEHGAAGGKKSKGRAAQDTYDKIIKIAGKLDRVFYNKDISSRTDLSPSRVAYFLKTMSDVGYIERLKKTNMGYGYRVK